MGKPFLNCTLNDKGFDGDVIEAALAHQEENEVRRAYNRSKYSERRRKLVYWWSEHITQEATSRMPTLRPACEAKRDDAGMG
mgnify:CR=1 FL=1